MRITRLIAGYGAIACALPYLALKVIWLSGGSLGVANPRVMHDTSMTVLNAITAGMDLVGIGMALAFTHDWGLRVPAPLLLAPMWVASGLLARFVLVVPLTALAVGLPFRSSMRVSGGPVEPWVYAVVYSGFTGLGIGLVVGFALYAWRRWSETLRSTTRAWPPGPTHHMQAPLATAAALMAMASAGLHVAWVLGASVGLSAEAVARRTIVSSMLDSVDAVLMVGAAVGIVMMVHRVGGDRPFWVPLALSWVGSGFLFAWGLWQLVNVLGQTALVVAGPVAPAIVNLDGLLRLLSGLVIGLVTLVLLAERRAAAVTGRP